MAVGSLRIRESPALQKIAEKSALVVHLISNGPEDCPIASSFDRLPPRQEVACCQLMGALKTIFVAFKILLSFYFRKFYFSKET
jgi:hypothetical protein